MIVIHRGLVVRNRPRDGRDVWHVAVEDTEKTGIERLPLKNQWLFTSEHSEQEALAKESELKAHYEKN